MIPHSIHVQTCLPNARFLPDSPVQVTQISCDSRQVPPGCAFVAIRGTKSDGHQFIGDAIAAGAIAVVVEHPQGDLEVPQIVVESTRRAWNLLCMAMHGNPQDHLNIAGITGTNGKTTTAWLLRNILIAAGYPTGMIGTVEYSNGRQRFASHLTTPDAEIQAPLMASMLTHGVRHCVMEVSSHALQQDRCSPVQLAAAAITNITDDHMDYHGTPEAYRAAKARIAGLLHCDAPLLVNGDDVNIRQLLNDTRLTCPVITFGRQPASELRYTVQSRTHRSQRLHLALAQGDISVRVRMIGNHNAANCMVAAGLAEQLGIGRTAIASGLEATREVPGRLERIDEGQPFQVFVDYAHTPDALRNCLTTVREFTHGNLICVFGAGGDRDQVKRPAMAKAVAAADRVFLTSDNPRLESPAQIISDILEGFSTQRHVEVDTDRKAAIRRALYVAQPGDAVVLSGKGHEKSQVIGTRSISFDDCQVARQILRELAGPAQDVNTEQHGGLMSPGLLTYPA
ncbi:MAG: UDP-N-acetylmuramoyl-L-alanyl-D-glutamate--2,6-diaminopimelate ligase [Fuerstiella sp.]|nr:UDP-N-acetylmuramoyl-L-alanyl-D-glutamate--2,6-diaminopimelate ligase [Fuerstiella sp.]